MLKFSMMLCGTRALNTHALKQLNYNKQHQPPILHKIETFKYLEKTVHSYSNKLNNAKFPCEHCNGFGYMTCLRCQEGCWRCDNTTLRECVFCGGTGNGGNKIQQRQDADSQYCVA